MHRDMLPPSHGMLFLYERPGKATFWMKNTRVSLDILFMDKTGAVTRMRRNAIPFDATAIDGGDDVLAVLEINAGLIAAFGVGEGTVGRHPRFDQSIAAWSCDASH